jgi:hypothetical protein
MRWKVRFGAGICLATTIGGLAVAGEAPVASGPTLLKGASVEIQIDDPVSSKTSKPGDTFRIHLAEALVRGGVVIVPAGATGMGEVVHAARAGMSGSPGELILAARHLQHGDIRIPLTRFRWGTAVAEEAALRVPDTGKNNQDLALGVGIAAGIVGLFISGGNIDIAVGAPAHARLASDVVLAEPATPSPPGAPQT